MRKKHKIPDEEDFISKSQIKREADELKKFGREIYEMPKKKRNKLPLNNQLIAAFEEADRIKSNEALRRHFQYVGKLLRDADIDSIHAAIHTLEVSPLTHQRKQMRLDETIDRLLQDGNSTSEALLKEQPRLNRQTLNQLIRNTISAEAKLPEGNVDSPAKRKLKKYLAEGISNT